MYFETLARVGPATVRALAARLDPVLLAIARETTGDLAEAIALMWHGSEDGARSDSAAPPQKSLANVVAVLAPARDKTALAAAIEAQLDRLDPAGRVAFLRLATGRLAKPRVSLAVAQGALARFADRPRGAIEAAWADTEPPYDALFAWASGDAPTPASPTAWRFPTWGGRWPVPRRNHHSAWNVFGPFAGRSRPAPTPSAWTPAARTWRPRSTTSRA